MQLIFPTPEKPEEVQADKARKRADLAGRISSLSSELEVIERSAADKRREIDRLREEMNRLETT